VGGTDTVTFNGFVAGGGSGVGVGPSLIVVEIEVPEMYQVCSVGLTATGRTYNSMDQGGTASAGDSTIQLRLMANNGGFGGANCSDTGEVSMSLTPAAVNPATRQNAIAAVAFINQFLDCFMVTANYNNYGPTSPYFTTSGTLIATTYEPTGGGSGNPGCSLGVAYQDFPYLNGPVQADCANPPNGTVGVVYGSMGAGHYLVAAGGTAPYTFTQVGGMLPPGLTLTVSGMNAGLISGTPTAAGKFLFTVLVADAGGTSVFINCDIAICPAGVGSGGNAFY
jgi:hypothetical protein